MAVTRSYTFVDYATQGYTALVALLVLLFHNQTLPHWGWILAVQVAILVLVHFTLELHQKNPSNGIIDFLRHFYPVLLFTWFYAETGLLNRLFFSQYMDPLIIGWEQSLFGFQPSILFMEKLPWMAVSEVFYAAYFSYYIMIAGVGLALYLRNRDEFFHYISVVSFVFYICYVLYIMLPIAGPPVFFHQVPGYSLPEALQNLAPHQEYPTAVQHGIFFKLMAFIYRIFEAPGAAFPSSHVAIALTTVFFSFRYLRKIRYPHLVAAILLCAATIYCRYHYVLDVLAGSVTALVLVPAANWLYWRSSKRLIKEPVNKSAQSLTARPP